MTQRFEVRRARLTPVVVSHDDWERPQTLVATDVSPRGLFLASDLLLRPDQVVRVSFRLGTPHLFELDGRVVRAITARRTTDLGTSGVGLELIDAKPVVRLKIRGLLRGVPPPLPAAVRLEQARRNGAMDRRRSARGGGRRGVDLPRSVASWTRRNALRQPGVLQRGQVILPQARLTPERLRRLIVSSCQHPEFDIAWG